MAMAKTLTRTGRKPGDFVEDRGCRFSPMCAGCWLVECYYLLDPADRKILDRAWRTLAAFKARPDGTIPLR